MPKTLLHLAFITAAILLPLAAWTRHWLLALIAGPVVLAAWIVIVRGRANENRQPDGPQTPLDTPDHHHDGN